MEIYLINILLLSIYGCIYMIKGKKVKKFLYMISIIQLILIIGLRDVEKVGKDWVYYGKYYDFQLNWNIKNIINYTRYEVGFKLLTKIISYIYNNKNFYAMILSCISIMPVAKTIYQYSKMPFLSLMVYISLDFYAFNFSGLRQAIAIAIVFYSYKYIIENKKIKFLLAMMIAIGFHKSALVFFPAIFVRKVKINKTKIGILIISSIFVYLFKASIFKIVNGFFYDNYSMSVTNSFNWMFMCICITIMCFLFYKKILKNDEKINRLYMLVAIGAIIMLFSPIVSDALRIANYYYIFIIILIPEVIWNIQNFQQRITILFFGFLAIMCIYIFLLKVDGYGIVPYKVFWEI